MTLKRKTRASEKYCLHYPQEELSFLKKKKKKSLGGVNGQRRDTHIKNQAWKIIFTGKGRETKMGFADIIPETELQSI